LTQVNRKLRCGSDKRSHIGYSLDERKGS